jgi:DNA sulfur modification protein DndD
LKNILRKKDFVKEITIDPETFQLNVIGRKGNDISVQSLSAGERQMLATAILRAIMAAKCSSIPVVVDTPLARLDGTHRMNLVKDFYSKVSHQVIILSTDEEITGSLKNEIDKYLSHSYQFVFNEDSQATTVTTNDRSDQN